MTTPHAYPLAWPEGLPRTKLRTKSPFRVSMSRAVSDLQDSLRLFGRDTGMPIRNLVISSNVTLGDSHPSDPGVAVYFDWDGSQRCIAIDRYTDVAANLRAVYMILEGRRQEMRYGGLHIVRAGFRGFMALPPPAGEAKPRPWREVFGVHGAITNEAAMRDFIEAEYRRLARERHPDMPGGSDEAMAELNAARAAALAEIDGGGA